MKSQCGGGKRRVLWPLSSIPEGRTWGRRGKPTGKARVGRAAPLPSPPGRRPLRSPQVCSRPPQRTWAARGHFLVLTPPSARPRPPPPPDPPHRKKAILLGGRLLRPGRGPAAPLAARPAPGCGFPAPQQVARDASEEPGNQSPWREGVPWAPAAEVRASGPPRPACAPGRPAPSRPARPCTCRAWALRVPAPLRAASLVPSGFWSWIRLPLAPSDHPFAGKWFYSGAGSWG